MPTPFPGMDPYLERPGLWRDVHQSLIAYLRDALAPLVRPHYYIAIEEMVYITEEDRASVRVPDLVVAGRGEVGPEQALAESDALAVEVPMPEEVRLAYLEVRQPGTHQLVTVVELLSPTNKRPGEGREAYLKKRREVLGTRIHLVEIDLLRAWDPMPVVGDGKSYDYRILLSRGNRRPRASLYVFEVRQPFPTFPLPLQRGDQEPVVDLGRLLHELYDRAGYDLRLDYKVEPEPPLRQPDAVWADALLREKQLR